GSGVTFYSERSGWLDKEAGGVLHYPADKIPKDGLKVDAADMKFIYPEADKANSECKTFQDCHGSIKIDGAGGAGYFVVLISKPDKYSDKEWTKGFSQTANDLGQKEAFNAN